MNNQEKYNHSISVLVKAYLNDTLRVGSFCACAVGNLIADACGIKIIKVPDCFGNLVPTWEGEDYPIWDQVFYTSSVLEGQIQDPEAYTGEVKDQIDYTGYTWQQLAQIENAFEKGAHYADPERQASTEEKMYGGLMAVVDVLSNIHGIDQETTQQSKLLFVKSC